MNREPKDYESAGTPQFGCSNELLGCELEKPTETALSGAQQKAQHFCPSSDIDPGLERLAELWPKLSEFDRRALVGHAEHLAALRGGIEAVAGLDDSDASESRLPASYRSGQTTARPVKRCGFDDGQAACR